MHTHTKIFVEILLTVHNYQISKRSENYRFGNFYPIHIPLSRRNQGEEDVDMRSGPIKTNHKIW